MANLSEAFTVTRQPENSKNDYLQRLKQTLPTSNNKIEIDMEDKYMYFENMDKRVKVSNPKYDNITRQPSTYGYSCAECNGSFEYHFSIQNKFPHDFIKGVYKKFS